MSRSHRTYPTSSTRCRASPSASLGCTRRCGRCPWCATFAGCSPLAAPLVSESRSVGRACVLRALGIAAVPVIRGQDYIDFRYHIDKRGILKAVRAGKDELIRWDPISKIDVIDETFSPLTATAWH